MTASLFLDMNDDGEAEFSAAMMYLSQTLGTEYAERFSHVAEQVLRERCETIAQEIAENGKIFDRTHEAASLRFAQPVYRADVSLSRRRARRSSAGLWYVFYALEDRAGVGQPDTLVVLSVRHGAAEPFRLDEPAE